MDVVLINPGSARQIMQTLADDYAAIEPPFWVAVIAGYLRNNGIEVAIIDANADNLNPEAVAKRVSEYDPLLTCVIVYGSHPSASTQNMTAAGSICAALKTHTASLVALGGLHPSALPARTIAEEKVDFVIDGEGPITIRALLEKIKKSKNPDLSEIHGLWWRSGKNVLHTERYPVIKNLDDVMPMAAWDLLPMHKYRAHNWHCFQDIAARQPYAAVYTSLGCPYNCSFCCINAIFGKPGIRFRSPDFVLRELKMLQTTYGVRNIKIVDELFVLRPEHYMGIVDGIIENDLKFNIWCYARVDTVKPDHLKRMKAAGINWLALGIESASENLRDSATKHLHTNDIKDVVKQIQDAGISVIGNYIFGLPDETESTMQQTLDLALDLNCEYANFYCCMAYPGSRLYDEASASGAELPETWTGYSQLAYDTHPLPGKYLTAAEILRFRDKAFDEYFANPTYLGMVEKKFGLNALEHIKKMASKKLRRKILGD